MNETTVTPEAKYKFNTFRNRVAIKLANLVLLLATDQFRNLLKGAIIYGLNAAARDEVDGRPAPPKEFIW